MLDQTKCVGDVIETDLFTVWLGEDGILYDTIKPDSVFGKKEAKALLDAYHTVSPGVARPVFHEMSAIRSADRAAREEVASPYGQEQIKALAIIIRSPVSRVLGNFFIGLNKPSFPTRLFTNYDEAKAWLAQFLA